jgi:hypothetical protein
MRAAWVGAVPRPRARRDLVEDVRQRVARAEAVDQPVTAILAPPAAMVAGEGDDVAGIVGEAQGVFDCGVGHVGVLAGGDRAAGAPHPIPQLG